MPLMTQTEYRWPMRVRADAQTSEKMEQFRKGLETIRTNRTLHQSCNTLVADDLNRQRLVLWLKAMLLTA